MDLPLSPLQCFLLHRNAGHLCMCVREFPGRGKGDFLYLVLPSSFQTYLLFSLLHVSLFHVYFPPCIFAIALFTSLCSAFYVHGSSVFEGREPQAGVCGSVQPKAFHLRLKLMVPWPAVCSLLVDASHLISEIITAFEGELNRVVQIILSSKNLNCVIGLRVLASFSLEKRPPEQSI